MRAGRVFGQLNERGLRVLFAGVFVALAVPATLLVAQAYSQLKWEAFRATQLVAEELVARIDAELRAAVAAEDARAFGDYSFLLDTGDAAANFVQRSPLAAFPVASALPGVLGYFQVDAEGRLSTPLLPVAGAAASYAIAPDEEAARAERVARIRAILGDNQLLRAPREAPAPSAIPPLEAQAAFDRLASVSALRTVSERERAATAARDEAATDAPAALEALAIPVAPEPQTARQVRVERELAPRATGVAESSTASGEESRKTELAVRTFASEIDPFELGVLQTGHFVLFRNVWRDGRRYIQGALIEQAAFLATAIEEVYGRSSVAPRSHLDVTFEGRTLGTFAATGSDYSPAARDLSGALLHRARLSPPFGGLELALSVDSLPRAPGATVLAWLALTLLTVLCGGFWSMYRLALGQLRLVRKQQDFVSAVSHELKTPLTSIRMYGEMLRAGWADESKKRVYYDYIHSESERLSRLIDNVLELARLTRSTRRFTPVRATVAELLELARSKVATQVERAGFELVVRDETPGDTAVIVDTDACAQILINLVDNAVKFARTAQKKIVEIGARVESDGGVLVTVRDFGPGVPKAALRKIFELFYRAENELTRETAGTGIGLALVQQLAAAMNARIDVRNVDPGAEFRLHLPTRATVNG